MFKGIFSTSLIGLIVKHLMTNSPKITLANLISSGTIQWLPDQLNPDNEPLEEGIGGKFSVEVNVELVTENRDLKSVLR